MNKDKKEKISKESKPQKKKTKLKLKWPFKKKDSTSLQEKNKPKIKKTKKIKKQDEKNFSDTITKERIRSAKEKRKFEKLRGQYTNQKTILYETPKNFSKLFLIFLIFLMIIVFVGCYFIFGLLISAALTFVFIVCMSLTQILDNTTKSSKLRKVIKTLSIIVITGAIFAVVVFVIFFIYIVIKAPEFDVANLEKGETTLIYDKNNNLVGTLGTEKREKVTYDELPEILIDALIATEDSRFFQHNGFDAPRFIKATIGQLLGRDAGGASTLTMQVAKNNFSGTDVTITRKFTDIYLSIFKIERAFTKQEIIEFYVNAPYLGSSAYGVEQAAQTYFGKNAKDINLSEAALIVGLLQAPGQYDPNINPEGAYERREVVLNLMVRHGYITEEERDIANSILIEDLLIKDGYTVVNEFQGYIDLVVEEVLNKTGLDAYIYPMIIYTNMDSAKQAALNNIYNGKTYNWINDSVQSGAASIDTKTGKILAVGAGRNRTGERVFSFATDINRQIGSTAKPLFDYGPGFEYNNWSTAKIFNDVKTIYGGSYMSNFDFVYKGKITLRQSLRESRNVPALVAFREVDNVKIKQFVTSLGIEPEIDSNGQLHEAHSVGAFNGSNPLTMAAAYAAFSNGGYYYEPYAVNKIVLRDSNEEMEFKSTKTKVMSDSTAYMITSVLLDVSADYGISYAAGTPVAVKTGSTNYDYQTRQEYGYPSSATPDGWMVGYTTDTALAIWVGYNENVKERYLLQSEVASLRNSLYKACAKSVFNRNSGSFTKPASVVSVKVEKGSDPTLLPSEWTPEKEIITELFKRGTEPTEVSKKYRPLENVTNLFVSYADGKINLTWDLVTKPNDLDDADFGEFGYFIYKDDTLLEFVTEGAYEHITTTPYGIYKIITGYYKNTFNRSNGVTVSLNNPITFEYNGTESLNLHVGETYNELTKPITVYEDHADMTNYATITISIINKDKTEVTAIDTSKEGTYIVTYKAVYLGESKTYKRTVNISLVNE